MNKRVLACVLAACCLLFSIPAQAKDDLTANPLVEALKTAYPDAGLQFEQTPTGIWLTVNNEKILLQPEGPCPWTSEDSPQDAPLCAMLVMPYPAGNSGRYPEEGFDPGRIRNQAFLMQLYGKNRDEVAKNCVTVNFLGKKVQFSKRQGAAAALARVSARLEPLLRTDPKLKEYIFPLAGTFSWRTISGLNRLSAHSFAIAIDLNVKKGLYWKWNDHSAAQLETTRQQYPQAIVDAFEAEGFIWGGKWSAYDFMHFEYRPELFLSLRQGSGIR